MEKRDFEEKCQRDIDQAEREKRSFKDKRFHYMQGLDKQIVDNM